MENYPEKEKEIVIEKAEPDDARSVAEILYKTWLATYPNEDLGITVDDVEDRYKDAFTEEALSKRREKITNPPSGETLLLAKAEGKPVGLVRVISAEDGNQLRAIYVLPEYQGKGVGRKLWEEGKKLFDPQKDISLTVAAYNNNAIDFYKKLGFEDTGKRWSDEKFKMKSGAMIPEMEMVKKAKIS